MRDEVQLTTIKPSDIDLSDSLSNTFGSTEREELATELIKFAQHKGNWGDFRRSELREFIEYDIYLDEAEQNEFVQLNDQDGTYSFMGRLIDRAYEQHPKK